MGKLVIKNGFSSDGGSQITGSLTISGSFNAHGNASPNSVIIGDGAGAIASAATAYNVFIGRNAGGNDNDFGDNNVLIGNEEGYLGNQTGNTSIGYHAGRGWGTTGATPTTGYNTSIGYQSAYNAAARSTETHNTSVGAFTARNLTAGSGNTLLGYYAGYNNLGDGNIIIGSGSVGVASMTNQLRIGNGESVTVISASLATGDIIFSSTASAAYFAGNGSGLTNIPNTPTSQSIYYTADTPDQDIFNDGKIYIKLNDASTDDIQAEVLTNPTSGDVTFTWESAGAFPTSGGTELNTGDLITTLNGNFGSYDKMSLVVYAPGDTSYPYYEFLFTKGAGGTNFATRYNKWDSLP